MFIMVFDHLFDPNKALIKKFFEERKAYQKYVSPPLDSNAFYAQIDTIREQDIPKLNYYLRNFNPKIRYGMADYMIFDYPKDEKIIVPIMELIKYDENSSVVQDTISSVTRNKSKMFLPYLIDYNNFIKDKIYDPANLDYINKILGFTLGGYLEINNVFSQRTGWLENAIEYLK